MSTLREEFEAWKRTMDSGYEAWQAVEWATERAAKLAADLAHDAAIKYANGREVDFEQEVAAAIRGAEKEGAKGS